MKYATITGWKGDAGEKFHVDMAERVKGYENWNHRATELEVFSECESQFTEGLDAAEYELSQFHTVSGNTELMRFDEADFEIEWQEVEE